MLHSILLVATCDIYIHRSEGVPSLLNQHIHNRRITSAVFPLSIHILGKRRCSPVDVLSNVSSAWTLLNIRVRILAKQEFVDESGEI